MVLLLQAFFILFRSSLKKIVLQLISLNFVYDNIQFSKILNTPKLCDVQKFTPSVFFVGGTWIPQYDC